MQEKCMIWHSGFFEGKMEDCWLMERKL